MSFGGCCFGWLLVAGLVRAMVVVVVLVSVERTGVLGVAVADEEA